MWGSERLRRRMIQADSPNLAEAWRFSGWVKSWLAEPEAAIERFARAMRLDPLDSRMSGMRSGGAHAHFFAGPL